MDRKEQDILEKIKKQAEDIKTPESLKPDHVCAMLGEKKAKRRIKPYQIGAAAAACVTVIAGILAWGLQSGDEGIDSVADSHRSTDVISDDKRIAAAASYEEIYGYIKEYQTEMNSSRSILESADEGEAVASEESAQSDMMADTSAKSATESYSETNVRQEGVDEGDVVKTDGAYLYVLEDSGQEVAIIDTRNQRMEKISSVTVGADYYIHEFYLADDMKKLVMVCSRSMISEDGDIYPTAKGTWNTQVTEAITYDIQDVESPKEDGRVSQSGSYSSSRVADGHLYLFSEYYVGMDFELYENEPRSYVPLINGDIIKEQDVLLPPVEKANMYEVITSIDFDNPGEIKDSKAIFSDGGDIYVSNDNIYFYEMEWQYADQNVTTVRKIAYGNGELTAKAQGKFDGYLNDSFSIDEYDGNLRVVTTTGDTNSVYVLNEELEIIGSIEGLAEDERVYSARFMGDTGYFVTFRETDPLFSVDLSDPEKPKILGALKIPGFSEYLHFYGENCLLGIGMNVEEETQITDGVKLSMFDISDKADVKEEDTYILKNVYGTDIFYDYKAVLVDAERNLIGFAGYTQGGQNYYLFAYDKEDGFLCNMEEEINGSGARGARGVYIGDVLYVVNGNIIESYSLLDYKKIDDIIL